MSENASLAELQSRTPSQIVADFKASRELYEQVGRMVASAGVDYSRLADLLDQPVPMLQATLKAERTKLAIALLPRASQNLIEFTNRYYDMQEILMAELEGRLQLPEYLTSLTHEYLLKTIELVRRRLEFVEKHVALAPAQEKIIIPIGAGASPASIVETLRGLHSAMQDSGINRDQVATAEFEELSSSELVVDPPPPQQSGVSSSDSPADHGSSSEAAHSSEHMPDIETPDLSS